MNNNKRQQSRRSTGLLALCLLLSFGSAAQPFFNRLYTLQATAATFEAVAPYGSSGGFMAAATVRDSSTGRQAIRIGRFDATGTEQSSRYFNIPDDTARSIYVNYKAMTRVHDNCYAMAGTVLPLKVPGQYAFILLADSNGRVYRYKDLTYNDSINQINGIAYDGGQYLIAAGKHLTRARDSSYLLFYKFDTALNQLWVKQYHPAGMLADQLTKNLVADSSGYMLCGGGQNTGLEWEKGFKGQALLFKTDTAGRELWTWTSPTRTYAEYMGFIGAALRTQDGGYLFTTMGRTYNSLKPSDPGIRLKAKQVIVKLDAARNPLWEVMVDDYFLGYGYAPASLLELADGSFIFLGTRIADSIAPLELKGLFVLQRYSPSGVLLDQHNIKSYQPRAVDDTHPESSGPINHIIQLPDKGFLLAGWYENRTAGAPPPTQRGWLLKLDSNGCLGPADTQCHPPTAISDPQQQSGQFTVYPNPSGGAFTITSTNVIPGGTKWSEGSLHISDLLGRIVHRQPVSFGNNTATISVQTVPGVYLLELISTTGERYRQKILIE